jgi:hypothetical protein
MNSLDPEKMNDKAIPKPSASMLNAALSFLKATDPSLGQPTPEEIQEQMVERMTGPTLMADGTPFVPRVGVMDDYNEGLDLPAEPVVDAEGNVSNVSTTWVEYLRDKLDDDQAQSR